MLSTEPNSPLPFTSDFKGINVQFTLINNPFIMPCGAAGVVLWPCCALIMHAEDGGCFVVPECPFAQIPL